MDTVFFMNLRATPGRSRERKFGDLLAAAGALAGNDELVAIKVHVGENGNLSYVNHDYARLAIETVRKGGGKPFCTDTNTLYSGGRHNAVDHHATALRHGYFSGTIGAPFIVADGLRGLDYEELPVSGKHFRKAKIGSALCQAGALLVLSHFKGHCEMGFGGAIKNLGMGCAAIPGKLDLHSSSQPEQKPEKCVACGQCVRRCPEGAIAWKNKKAVIDYGRCIGCGQCVAACGYGAMNVKWESHGEALLEKVAEYAAAVQARYTGKCVFVNFAFAITPDCDCWDYNDAPLVQDVGILASANPVALDRATLDLVKKSPAVADSVYVAPKKGANLFDAVHGTKSEYLFGYCNELGMSDGYELEEVG
ncbi:MAG: DUF362 domain-containing protein [Chitinispirillaceae bacterium]|nr:DUF362 domain-containing protein [Chitinispirillaceae bacterium]